LCEDADQRPPNSLLLLISQLSSLSLVPCLCCLPRVFSPNYPPLSSECPPLIERRLFSLLSAFMGSLPPFLGSFAFLSIINRGTWCPPMPITGMNFLFFRDSYVTPSFCVSGRVSRMCAFIFDVALRLSPPIGPCVKSPLLFLFEKGRVATEFDSFLFFFYATGQRISAFFLLSTS